MFTVKVSSPESVIHDIELMLDTGLAVSILPEEIVTELFPEASLMEPKLKLRDYGGNPIAVKGCLQANAAFGDLSTTTVFYIVKNKSAVLGRDLFYSLQMQVRDSHVTAVTGNQKQKLLW